MWSPRPGEARVLVTPASRVSLALVEYLNGQHYAAQLAGCEQSAITAYTLIDPDVVVVHSRHEDLARVQDRWRQAVVCPVIAIGNCRNIAGAVRDVAARVRRACGTVQASGPEASDAATPLCAQSAGETLRVDLQTLEVFSFGDRIRLTETEFRILALLLANAGQAVSRQRLCTALWGPRGERSTPRLDVHVGNLRRKVEPNPSAPALIRTIRGFGYRAELPN